MLARDATSRPQAATATGRLYDTGLRYLALFPGGHTVPGYLVRLDDQHTPKAPSRPSTTSKAPATGCPSAASSTSPPPPARTYHGVLRYHDLTGTRPPLTVASDAAPADLLMAAVALTDPSLDLPTADQEVVKERCAKRSGEPVVAAEDAAQLAGAAARLAVAGIITSSTRPRIRKPRTSAAGPCGSPQMARCGPCEAAEVHRAPAPAA